MKELVRQTFKYTDEKLASGAVVNADEVVVRDGKLISGRGTINVGENIVFSFSVYTGMNEKMQINCNNAPIDIDALGYIREFTNLIN